MCSSDLDWAALGRRTTKDRNRVREWSRCISGEAIAGYLEAILGYVYEDTVRPIAPWRTMP